MGMLTPHGGFGVSDKFILVTGGTGFIGSHLIKSLIVKGENLVILTRPNSDFSRLEKLDGKFKTIRYNDFLSGKIKFEIEGVIHLATYYQRFHKPSEIPNMITTNITIPTQVIDIAINYGAKFVLNTSTFFRYRLSAVPIDEKVEVSPYNFYAATKVSFEKILDFYSSESGLKAITLVLFSPYGPNDNPAKFIPSVINNALTKTKMSLTDGTQRLDFTFIKDIIQAYECGITYLRNSAICGHELFNIGSGRNYSIKEVVSEIERQIDIELSKSWDRKSVDSFEVLADIGKAKDVLGWAPVWNLTSGIRETIELFRGE